MLDHISASSLWAACTISSVSVAALPALKQNLIATCSLFTAWQYGFTAQN
jgi:hypothetical protein